MSEAEEQIRALIEERIAAVRGKDAARAIATLADDVVAFELAPPLAVNADKARDQGSFEKWLAGFETIDVEVRDLKIETGGDVGFARALHHLTGTRPDGRKVSLWVRSTLGLRREDGAWKIAHAHTSVPFHMDGSFRAAIGLRP
jgi:ketosteroid isomerase-like protein